MKHYYCEEHTEVMINSFCCVSCSYETFIDDHRFVGKPTFHVRSRLLDPILNSRAANKTWNKVSVRNKRTYEHYVFSLLLSCFLSSFIESFFTFLSVIDSSASTVLSSVKY